MNKWKIKINNINYNVINNDKVWKLEECSNGKVKNVEYTTRELFERYSKNRTKPTLRYKNEVREHKEQQLPIHPYLLGYFLGDGSSSDGSIVVWNKILKEMIDLFKSYGYGITSIRKNSISSCSIITLNYKGKPLITLLRENGLLNNKHIPSIYMESSIEQRRDLVRGLMDSDGSINKKGLCEFSQKKEPLMEQFSKLLWGLGIKNYPKLRKYNDKRTKKEYSFYYNRFSPYNFKPFNLVYKLERVKDKYKNETRYSYIQKIEKIN